MSSPLDSLFLFVCWLEEALTVDSAVDIIIIITTYPTGARGVGQFKWPSTGCRMSLGRLLGVVNVLAVNDNDELNVVQGSDGIFGLQDDASNNKSTTAAPKPENCKDLIDQGNTATKWYTVYMQDGSSISVYCDMDTDGGGWLVFQRRVDGSVDFYRGWSDYKSGFGSGGSEFWLGNDNINTLTSAGNYELRIDMRNSWFMTYSSFKINAESDNYRLNLGSPSSGNAGDYLSYNNQQPFST
ncbi:ficolin-2-like [Amia ocellicauda]|uniref:ficolin-2-like n=1 Tax=Amia ocellicauda TaxID=2972642 RepID=UPI003464271E